MSDLSHNAEVPRWLRNGAGYAWRFIVIVAALALIIRGMVAVPLVDMALFLAAVITAALRPLAQLIARVLPRWMGTVIAFLVALAIMAGIALFVTMSVSNQFSALSKELGDGLNQINRQLQSLPLDLPDLDLAKAGENIQNWIVDNQGAVVHAVLSRAGMAAEIFTAVVLGIFCSVFFITSGTSMWSWIMHQLPSRARRYCDTAAKAAWSAFAGYTRGIFLVAATNGLLCGIALWMMGIPLAAPLGVLVFLGTFIPYVGSAIALLSAVVVALAARGPWWALGVVGLIVIIGQIEGHLLQPLIMSKQVKLHPVIVAIAVVAGGLMGGLIGAVVAVPITAVVWSAFDAVRKLSAQDLTPALGPVSPQEPV